MGKIGVSCQGRTLDDKMDPRFGRAAYFLIVDPATLDYEVVDNAEAGSLAQGAGIGAAEAVARTGAEVILTGTVGPKARDALSAARIKIVQGIGGVSAREAVARYMSGQFESGHQTSFEPRRIAGQGLGQGLGRGQGIGRGGGRRRGGGR